MRKVTDELKKTMLCLSASGYSIAEISRSVDVSRKTVRKYLNENALGGETEGDEDDNFSRDIVAQLTEREKRFIDRAKQENILYNDPEEQWLYHVTEQQLKLLGSGIWFVGVVYPESAPPDWKQKLNATGLQWACSPLHDMDHWSHDNPAGAGLKNGKPYMWAVGEQYKKGDKKKLHWHIIIKVDDRTPLRQINELIRPITHGPYLQVCKSLKGAYDYLTHIGQDPLQKYPYYKDGIEPEKHNGFVVEANSAERKQIQLIILNRIEDEKIDSFTALLHEYRNDAEFANVICSRPSAFTAAVRGQWMLKHPGENTSGQIGRLTDTIIDIYCKGE